MTALDPKLTLGHTTPSYCWQSECAIGLLHSLSQRAKAMGMQLMPEQGQENTA